MKKYHVNPKVKILYDSLLEYGLTLVIQTSARSSLNNESIIDQISININLLTNNNMTMAGNAIVGITDHKLQYFILNNKKTSQRN